VARLKSKKLIPSLLTISMIIWIWLIIPKLKIIALDIFESPLKIFHYTAQEFKAIILFHHNFRENKRLSKEIDSLRERLNRSFELYIENKRLQRLLSFKTDSYHHLVAARVIARDPSYWSSVIIIDKGKTDGISDNQAVISPAGLIGKVIEVGRSTSKVMLLNDINFGISAIIQRTRQEGLLSGTLENKLIMRYLPVDSDVRIGDVIITSGLTKIFPKGIIIGKVTETGKEFSGLSIFCLIKPAINLSSLEEVLVIVE
jgi:rod shape-determining protein MreC